VKINSLFTDKAYSFAESGDPKDDCKFAVKALEKLKPDFKIKQINLLGVEDHFDVFILQTPERHMFKLKISLSDTQKVLKKEATALRSCGCKNTPALIAYDTVKVGEEVTCLLTEVFNAESVRDHGRSIIIENLDDLLDAYSLVFDNKRVKNSYKNVLSSSLEEFIPTNCLPKDIVGAFQSYTNYPLCEKFLLTLKSEISAAAQELFPIFNHKCHASLSLDSLFHGPQGFYFDSLSTVCMGHPFVDFVDLILEMGVETKNESILLDRFCEKIGFPREDSIYNRIYHLQLRKKLGELIIAYIKEVYLYDSFRYQKILFIADTFSHCYERFCSIDIFEENRDFIMKTICEPIFGVKA
jgi:hypothetical protein